MRSSTMSAGPAAMKCPICKKEVVWGEESFSALFAANDANLLILGNWASERYRMPYRDEEPEEDVATEEKPSDEP